MCSIKKLIQLTFSLTLAGLFGLGLFLGLSSQSIPAAYAAGETCFATIDGTTVYSSTDASAVQTAVNAASSGDVIKVAGTCAGVQNVSGYTQTLYIGVSNLTIRGGYTTTNNWSVSDPTSYPTILSAGGAGRVVFVPYSGGTKENIVLDSLNITDGDAVGNCGSNGPNSGGGICLGSAKNFTLLNSQVYSNVAQKGGGIYRHGGGEALTISNTTIFDNLATSDGGGIYLKYNTLVVQNSTINNNTATQDGGGLFIDSHQTEITNTTISHNTANRDGGGAYFVVGSDPYEEVYAEIAASTVASNTATGYGGGIYRSSTPVTLTNTILAYNTAGSSPDCLGTLYSGDYNLIEDTTGCTFVSATNDITQTDPLLGPLADNGGETQTHALLSGSPALDVIPAGTNGCGDDISTDQRGLTRPLGSGCDIGAYEAEPILMLTKAVTPTTNVTYHSIVTYTLVLSNSGVGSDATVLLTDTLPGEVTFGGFSSADHGASVVDDELTWTGVVTAGESLTWVFTATHTGAYGDSVTNIAEFSGTLEEGQAQANFTIEPPPTYTLSLNTTGDGSGLVTADPDQANYEHGTVVTLTATPDTGSEFIGWSGAVIDTQSEITLTMTSDVVLTATFEVPTYTLTINTTGDGSGSVAIDPDQANYEYGTVVTLTATPDANWFFLGWSGDVTDTRSEITFTMTSDVVLTATFDLPTYTLSLNTAGDGSGAVIVDPDQANYEYGTVVTLTAMPDTGSYFLDWTGAVIDTQSEITLTMTSDVVLTATFDLLTYTLTVNTAGDGGGAVTVDPDQASYDYGSVVTLTATPDSGSDFAGWSGDLTGTTNPVTLTMTATQVVTATFIQEQQEIFLPFIIKN